MRKDKRAAVKHEKKSKTAISKRMCEEGMIDR